VVNGKRADRTTLLAVVVSEFIHSVKKAMAGVDCQKRRVRGRSRQTDQRHFSGMRIELINVNALAGAVSNRVGTHVHKIIADGFAGI
jgi:hypothetical protein